MADLFEHFKDIKDPRVNRTRRHSLADVIAITIVGVLGGASGWDEMVLFAKAHEPWFRRFCELEHGVPSADTLRRVVSRIDPDAFEKSFRDWITAAKGCVQGLVAIDGKTVKNIQEKRPLHILSAYSDSLGVSIGQEPTGDKGGEYEAIPRLLKDLDVSGCLITTDAGGCYTEIAEEIVNKSSADYLLQVKGNQPTLHEELKAYFQDCNGSTMHGATRNVSKNSGHGRQEKRTAYSCQNTGAIPSLAGWPEPRSFGMVICERTVGDKTSTERHYYISSRPLSARKLGQSVRAHWGIENGLHWVLDTTFSEDGNPIRVAQGQQNLSVARKIVSTANRTSSR